MDQPSMPPPETPSGAHPAVEAATPDSKKRSRQPRNSACEKCAALKMRCVRSADGERCESNVASKSSLAFPPPVSKPVSASPLTGVSADSLLSRNDLHYTGSKSFGHLLTQSLGLDTLAASPADLLSGIDANALVNACTVFRQHNTYFPFVSIPMRIDPVSMAFHRPMTALAVNVVTAAADHQRQDHLSQTFRHALSSKAIVNGERSIDLLVGLLIYIAWNHQYITKQQIYQHLNLLSGMAVDLGLYAHPPRGDIKDPVSAAELDRAFVGTYYLCSMVSSFAFNKHSPMRWTENLRVCAGNVAQGGEFQSDRSVISLLELATTIDDMQSAFLDSHAPSKYIGLQARGTSQRLKALRRDHPALATDAVMSACFVHALYEQIYHNGNPDSSVVIQCACAVQEYFDDLLSKPPYVLHQTPIVDWTCLLHVTVLTTKLSRQAAEAAGWEHGALTSMLQPEQTMDKLFDRMASAPAGDALAPRHDGLLSWFRQFVQTSKDIVLAHAPATANPPGDGSDGRFRPMNSNETLPVADRALPHVLQERRRRARTRGVLDQDFWRHNANE